MFRNLVAVVPKIKLAFTITKCLSWPLSKYITDIEA